MTSTPPPPQVRVLELASWWQRARGLLGRAAPGPGAGVWIHPCRQVHTLGMAYTIDVIYLGAPSQDGHPVIGVQSLRPWRIGRYFSRAEGVLELAEGEAARLGLRVGSELCLIPDPTAC